MTRSSASLLCRTAPALLCVALPILLIAGCGRPSGNAISDLAWLNGCWEGKSDEGLVDEQWGRPAGGSILGASRVVSGERTVFVEFLEIRQSVDGLVLVVHPLGQAPASYRLRKHGRSEVVFENLAHDFPQRITYHRDAGTLQVRAEGAEGDDRRPVRYKLRKTGCD